MRSVPNVLILKELTGVPAKKDILEILLPLNFLSAETTVETAFISELVIAMRRNVSKVQVYTKTLMAMEFQIIVKGIR